jgi:hypothetical protein
MRNTTDDDNIEADKKLLPLKANSHQIVSDRNCRIVDYHLACIALDKYHNDISALCRIHKETTIACNTLVCHIDDTVRIGLINSDPDVVRVIFFVVFFIDNNDTDIKMRLFKSMICSKLAVVSNDPLGGLFVDKFNFLIALHPFDNVLRLTTLTPIYAKKSTINCLKYAFGNAVKTRINSVIREDDKFKCAFGAVARVDGVCKL